MTKPWQAYWQSRVQSFLKSGQRGKRFVTIVTLVRVFTFILLLLHASQRREQRALQREHESNYCICKIFNSSKGWRLGRCRAILEGMFSFPINSLAPITNNFKTLMSRCCWRMHHMNWQWMSFELFWQETNTT